MEQNTSWCIRCEVHRSLEITFGMELLNYWEASLSFLAVNPTCRTCVSWHECWNRSTVISLRAASSLAQGHRATVFLQGTGLYLAASVTLVCSGKLGNVGSRLPHVQVWLCPIIICLHRPEWHSWYLLTAPRRFLESEALLVGVIGAELWAMTFLSCSTAFWEEEEVLITPWALSQSSFPQAQEGAKLNFAAKKILLSLC